MRQDAPRFQCGFLDTRRNHTLIFSAILAGLCPLVGNGLYAGPQGDGQAILDDIQSEIPVIAYIAYPLEPAGFVSMAVVLAWLVVNLRRHAPVRGTAHGEAVSATRPAHLRPRSANPRPAVNSTRAGCKGCSR